MPAPIQSYSDIRLNGSSLVIPFLQAQTIAQKFDALPNAIWGKIHQIVHYHKLQKEERENPPPISVGGLELPELKMTDTPKHLFVGGSVEKIEAIAKTGFDLSKTRKYALLGAGVYLAKSRETAKAYGGKYLTVFSRLKRGEVAYLDATALAHFQLKFKAVLLEDGYDVLPALFLANGYKGIEYDLFDWKRGVAPQRGVVVYDPKCLKTLFHQFQVDRPVEVVVERVAVV